MTANARGRTFVVVATICGVILLPHAAGTVEVESDAIEGRTEAAIADFRNAMKLEPDLQHGAELFTTCAACHAASGLGTRDGSIPAIAGQHVSVLVKQLVDFRHDRRWGERMRNFASQHNLSGPQELLDVAAYAESLPRWPPLEGGTGDGSTLHEGYVIYHRDCAECHGPLGLGELRRMRPRLAGQRYQYLLRQLEETADRMRPGMDVKHVKLIGALSAEERRAVADYLSRLSPNLASTQDKAPKPP
jgi:cytochrome c553